MNNPSPQACGLDLTSFKPSTITLVKGPSRFVPDLLLYLCAHTANRHHQDVVFVDGGNSFNPYTLRSISKVLQADIKTVMTKTRIARAFTEYQMNDLLEFVFLPPENGRMLLDVVRGLKWVFGPYTG